MLDNKRPNEDAQFIAERRTVDVLDVLKRISDEEHPVTKNQILKEVETTVNPQTLSNTVDEILLQINPAEYWEDNDEEFRIKYDGYDLPFEENPLIIKSEMNELRKELRRKGADSIKIKEKLDSFPGGKAPTITNLRYIHDFNYRELDLLIEAVALSACISPFDKEKLIHKIMRTASEYYKTPFYDETSCKIKFNPYSEYSRLHTKSGEYENRLGHNIRILQEAIKRGEKVKFHFDVYSEDKNYVQDDDVHIVSPYYIVIYHDDYYLIGAWDNKDTACHYRIVLISGLEILRDKKGFSVKMKNMSLCKDLPNRDLNWDPAKYMSEHLYMAYDRPRRIKIKMSMDLQDRYTILHDWFGDYFKKSKVATAKCEDGFEIIEVVTSPTMIVHWALQYGEKVEIMDEEIRESIRVELEKLQHRYGRDK